jgi:hypothetical protein
MEEVRGLFAQLQVRRQADGNVIKPNGAFRWTH